MFEPVSYKRVKMCIESMGYQLFDQKPYSLNIIGVRNCDQKITNMFDDYIYVAFKDVTGDLCTFWYRATTDPGRYWVENPMNSAGTAILKEGQYLEAYTIGLHQKKYSALVQSSPVTVYRDRNKDNIYDYSNEQTGNFGINIHRSSLSSDVESVDRYSAGCQVFKHPEDFDHFMNLCYFQIKYTKFSKFSYTLINSSNLERFS